MRMTSCDLSGGVAKDYFCQAERQAGREGVRRGQIRLLLAAAQRLIDASHAKWLVGGTKQEAELTPRLCGIQLRVPMVHLPPWPS